MKTVIYHSADFDGIFCREVARHFLGGDGVNYVGWNFGDPKMPFPHEGDVYILDLSPECIRADNGDRALDLAHTIWIDHHKSSIEKWLQAIPGYRIDGVAACRLAWQWFQFDKPDTCVMPDKLSFINCEVNEPLAVRLAGEYDVAGPGANEEALDFQFGLRSTEIAGDEEQLLTIGEFGDKLVAEISERGRVVRGYLDRADLLTVKSAFPLRLDGLSCLAVNAYRGNSKAMQEAAKVGGHDAVMSFAFRGKGWTVSLYGVPGRDLDLSEVAKRHGGGGHKSACGFECDKLPFIPGGAA